MKNYIILFVLFIAVNFCAQTNLVPNPSFESYTACPSNSDEVYKCNNWISSALTPDYFNSCSLSNYVSVPYNFGGHRFAADGNAYMGLLTYVRPSLFSPNAREYITAQLTNSLVVGSKYFVSFATSLSISSLLPSNCATNKLGVAFAKTLYTATASQKFPDNVSKIYSTNKITDTLNWVTVFGSFIADSSYSHILIGNFFTDNNTDTLIMNSSYTCDGSYYYIDRVCVSTDSIFTKNYLVTNISNNKFNTKIKLYPTTITDFIIIENIYNEPYNIDITDVFGNVLINKNSINQNIISIDCSAIKPQMLLIRVYSNKYNYITKTIKQ